VQLGRDSDKDRVEDRLAKFVSVYPQTLGNSARRPDYSICATPTASRCSLRMLRSHRARETVGKLCFDMAREKTSNRIVALDVGTSKVVRWSRNCFPDGRLDIIGMGGHESKA